MIHTDKRAGGPPPALQARGIKKRFGHVEALRGVDVELHAGEVLGLVGDNGAGKSTLVKCLCGVYKPDEGEIQLNGQTVSFDSPMEARKRGIETVYQDLSLAPDISVAANVFLGRELPMPGILGKAGFLDFPSMRLQARDYIREIGIDLPSLAVPTEMLSGGQRQAVAIARARAWASSVLFLDEPTASLGVRQSRIVGDLIRNSSDSGMAILMISHDLPSIVNVADRIVVLRLGRVAGEFPATEGVYSDVVSAMLGKGA